MGGNGSLALKEIDPMPQVFGPNGPGGVRPVQDPNAPNDYGVLPVGAGINTPFFEDGGQFGGQFNANVRQPEYSSLIPQSFQERTLAVGADGRFTMPRWTRSGGDVQYMAPPPGRSMYIQDPVSGLNYMVQRQADGRLRLIMNPQEPYFQMPATAAQAQQQYGLQPGYQVDKKTGLPKSGVVTPGPDGAVDLPGVGKVDLKPGPDGMINVPDGKGGFKKVKPGKKIKIKIPGTKYKYELKARPDGSYDLKLKKPGIFSKIGGFFKKYAGIIGMVCMFIPGLQPVGLALRIASSAWNVAEGIKNGNWMQAVSGGAGVIGGLGAAGIGGAAMNTAGQYAQIGVQGAIGGARIAQGDMGGLFDMASAGLGAAGMHIENSQMLDNLGRINNSAAAIASGDPLAMAQGFAGGVHVGADMAGVHHQGFNNTMGRVNHGMSALDFIRQGEYQEASRAIRDATGRGPRPESVGDVPTGGNGSNA
jgi:hypothetical protein